MRALIIVALIAVVFVSVEAVSIERRLRRPHPPVPTITKPSKENQPCVSAKGAGICWAKVTCDKHKGTLYPAISATIGKVKTPKCPNQQQCCLTAAPQTTPQTTPTVPPTPTAPTTPPTPPTPTTPTTPATPPSGGSGGTPKPDDYQGIMNSICPRCADKSYQKLSFKDWSACSVPWADKPGTCRCRARADDSAYTCVLAGYQTMIDDKCRWSIEDRMCVSEWDKINTEALAHAMAYTKEQIQAYYDAQAKLPKPSTSYNNGVQPRDFQPVTNPYAYIPGGRR